MTGAGSATGLLRVCVHTIILKQNDLWRGYSVSWLNLIQSRSCS